MKVLTIANRKGGVGKTTHSRTLCEYFSVVRGMRVLAVDLDSQCSLSHLLLDMDMSQVGEQGARPPVHPEFDPTDPDQSDWNGRSSSADIFYGAAVFPYPAAHPQGADTLQVLPGNKELLTDVEEQDQPSLREKVEDRLREFLTLKEVAEAYDIAIVDTGPGASPLARSGLRACSHVLIPIELEPQCIRGLYEMIAEVRHEDMRRTLDTRVNIVAIQPNRYKIRRSMHRGLLETVQREFKDRVSPVIVPDLAGISERDADMAAPRSVFNLPPSNRARKVATAFCEFVASRVFEAPP